MQSRLKFPLTVRFRLFFDRIYPFSYYRLSRSRLFRSRSRFRIINMKMKTVETFSVRFRPFSSLVPTQRDRPESPLAVNAAELNILWIRSRFPCTCTQDICAKLQIGTRERGRTHPRRS
jgi:hypothetical protein